MKDMTLKILRIVLSSIMVGFAFLQVNDPDALEWIIIYGIVAMFGVLGSARQNQIRWLLSIGYIGLAWWLFPNAYYGVGEMNIIRPEIEQAREGFGVLIAAGINAGNILLFRAEAAKSEERINE